MDANDKSKNSGIDIYSPQKKKFNKMLNQEALD